MSTNLVDIVLGVLIGCLLWSVGQAVTRKALSRLRRTRAVGREALRHWRLTQESLSAASTLKDRGEVEP